MKPRILIPGPPGKADYFGPYLEAVRGADGDPVVDWPGAECRGEEAALRSFLGRYRGVLFPGGADVDPGRYGEAAHEKTGAIDPELDEGQFAVMKLALSGELPALAVCRGLQVLAVAAGGALYQDIPSQRPSDVRHGVSFPKDFRAHTVRLRDGSALARLSGALEFEVNSRHHQAARDGGDAERIGPLEIVARAPDGLIEGLEYPSLPFLVAVQWHPENLAGGHAPSRRLFEGFVAACDAEPVEMPIDGTLDLHTFQPSDVHDLVPDYLEACRAAGILRVRIVHGKGTGALLQTVHAILGRIPGVESFALADPAEGGWGATIVKLKP